MASTLDLDLHLSEVDEERAEPNQKLHQYMILSKNIAYQRTELEENIKRYEKLKKELNEELEKGYKEFTKESKCMILLSIFGNLPSYQVKSERHHNIFVRDTVLLG